MKLKVTALQIILELCESWALFCATLKRDRQEMFATVPDEIERRESKDSIEII